MEKTDLSEDRLLHAVLTHKKAEKRCSRMIGSSKECTRQNIQDYRDYLEALPIPHTGTLRSGSAVGNRPESPPVLSPPCQLTALDLEIGNPGIWNLKKTKT